MPGYQGRRATLESASNFYFNRDSVNSRSVQRRRVGAGALFFGLSLATPKAPSAHFGLDAIGMLGKLDSGDGTAGSG
jgi:hypothetical protein